MNRGWTGVVMVWQEAALPMSCYIVWKTTTRSVLRCLVAAWSL